MGFMKRKSAASEGTPARENYRYTISLPMEIELRKGLWGKQRARAVPVDLAIGGAACHVRAHKDYVVGKRFRLFIEGKACFAEVRNVRDIGGGLQRIGMEFIQLELETQERIVDAIDQAKFESSRLDRN